MKNALLIITASIVLITISGCALTDSGPSDPCKQKSREITNFGGADACTDDVTYGYEYNSESGKCVKVYIGSSSCPSAKTPFKSLDECQLACVPPESRCMRTERTHLLKYGHSFNCFADEGEGYVYDEDAGGCYRIDVSPDLCSELVEESIFKSKEHCESSCLNYR